MARKGKNKLTINFKGFEEYYEKLDRLGANLGKVTEKALQESYDFMTPNIEEAIQPHHLTGDTEKSLQKKSKVEWDGVTAYIRVGFSIREGGLASIFLMYGTPKNSPSHMDADRQLYDSVYGENTRKKVKKLQKEIFDEELRKAMR